MSRMGALTLVQRKAIWCGSRVGEEGEEVPREMTRGEWQQADRGTVEGLRLGAPSMAAMTKRGMISDSLVPFVVMPGGTWHRLLFWLLRASLCAHGGEQVVGVVSREMMEHAVSALHGDEAVRDVMSLAGGAAEFAVLTFVPRAIVGYGCLRVESSKFDVTLELEGNSLRSHSAAGMQS